MNVYDELLKIQADLQIQVDSGDSGKALDSLLVKLNNVIHYIELFDDTSSGAPEPAQIKLCIQTIEEQ